MWLVDPGIGSRITAFPRKVIILTGWSRNKTGLQQEEEVESKRQKTLQRELEWIQDVTQSPPGKGKARVNAYESLLSQEYENAGRNWKSISLRARDWEIL